MFWPPGPPELSESGAFDGDPAWLVRSLNVCILEYSEKFTILQGNGKETFEENLDVENQVKNQTDYLALNCESTIHLQ